MVGWVASYTLLSLAPTHVEVELRCDNAYLQALKGSHEFPHLPLLRGKRFELLGPGELADTLAHCLYCGRKIININTRLRHINTEHGAEHHG